MKTMLGSIALPNPVMPASGTFGFGYEMAKWYDINCLGAIALKGTTLSARYGNPLPRIAECDGGLLNAIGLQNPGVDAVIAGELPRLNAVYHGVKLANISGFSLEEYAETAARLDGADVDILEINISCPNVHGGGLAFGADARNAARVCAEVKKRCRKPVYMKLSPNVTDICAIARACEAEGADGLTVTNTLLGMVIDPRSGKPIVSTRMAGFSGPAIKPVSLRMVYQVYEAVRIPIIGAGGIATADDVLCYLSAGASAVQVGAQNLVDPLACKRIIEDLPRKMEQYGIESLQSIIGRAHQ